MAARVFGGIPRCVASEQEWQGEVTLERSGQLGGGTVMAGLRASCPPGEVAKRCGSPGSMQYATSVQDPELGVALPPL